MKKLNLGCGTDIREGWVNLDERQLPGVDVVCHITDSLPFDDEEFDEILMQDVLEHFPQDKTDTILMEVNRILHDNGTIVIEVPNLTMQAQQWLNGGIKTARFSQIVYGKQDYPGNFHYQLFDKELLEEVLERNGFYGLEFYTRGRALGVKAYKQ